MGDGNKLHDFVGAVLQDGVGLYVPAQGKTDASDGNGAAPPPPLFRQTCRGPPGS